MGDKALEYGQAVPLHAVKAAGGNGWTVEGYVSTFGNVDQGNDVVARGAFDQTLKSGRKVRFLFGHDSRQILGTTKDLRVDEKGLFGEFQISRTSLGQDVHTLLHDDALDSFSIGYIPNEFSLDDQNTRILKEIDLLEVSLVAIPMNDLAVVTGMKHRLYGDDETHVDDDPEDILERVKSAGDFDALDEADKLAFACAVDLAGDETKAVWSAAFINDLPDSAFAVILGGGKKDGEGKTTPRSLRKLPHHGEGGGLDMPHLRNALSRLPQTDLPTDAKSKAQSHLNGHAKSEGIGKAADDHDAEIAEIEVVETPDTIEAVALGLKALTDLAYEQHGERVLDAVEVFLDRSDDRHSVRARNGRKAGVAFYERLALLRSRVERLLATKGQPVGEIPTDGLRLRLGIARRKAELAGICSPERE